MMVPAPANEKVFSTVTYFLMEWQKRKQWTLGLHYRAVPPKLKFHFYSDKSDRSVGMSPLCFGVCPHSYSHKVPLFCNYLFFLNYRWSSRGVSLHQMWELGLYVGISHHSSYVGKFYLDSQQCKTEIIVLGGITLEVWLLAWHEPWFVVLRFRKDICI